MVTFCANCRRIPKDFFHLYTEDEIRSRSNETSSSVSPASPHVFELHPSHASLTASALICPLCRLILYGEILEESDLCMESCPSCLEEEGPVRLECGSPFDPETIRIYSGSYWITTLVFTTVPESWQPSDDVVSAVDIVKKWIDCCQESHPICRQHQSNFIPSRLIDLSPPEGNQQSITARIQFESNVRDLPDGVKYAALSYCWGSSMPEETKTTTQNLSSRALSGIPEASLPLTIRDAMAFTRRLGLRYLWVDALCILQDSERDWKSQSTKMAQIFSAAHITLAASAAPDTTTGFPRYEPFSNTPTAGSSRHVFLPFPAERPNEVLRRICLSLYPRDEVSRIKSDPLQGRGWALQERHLSTRVAHLSWPYPIWECRTAGSSRRLPWLPWSATTRREGRLLDGGSGPALAERVREYLAKGGWATLVLEYTRRSLTFDRDVFYAIAGLAAAVDAALACEDQYLAGLWRSTLPVSLCWKTGGLRTGEDRERLAAARRRAPSWSWASMIGPIYIGAEPEETISIAASVLGAKCTASHDRELGLKYDGWLRLKAPLKKVFICAAPPDQAAGLDEDLDSNYNAVLFGHSGGERPVGCMELDVNPEREIRYQEAFCLAISTEPRLLSRADDRVFPSGFLAENWKIDDKQLPIVVVSLVLVSTGKDGEYRRIGISEYMPESAYDSCEEHVVTII